MSENTDEAMQRKTLTERLGAEPQRWESRTLTDGMYDKDRNVYTTKQRLADGREIYSDYRLLPQTYQTGENLIKQRHFQKIERPNGKIQEIEMKWNGKKGIWEKSGYLDQLNSTVYTQTVGTLKESPSPEGPKQVLHLRETNKLIPLMLRRK